MDSESEGSLDIEYDNVKLENNEEEWCGEDRASPECTASEQRDTEVDPLDKHVVMGVEIEHELATQDDMVATVTSPHKNIINKHKSCSSMLQTLPAVTEHSEYSLTCYICKKAFKVENLLPCHINENPTCDLCREYTNMTSSSAHNKLQELMETNNTVPQDPVHVSQKSKTKITLKPQEKFFIIQKSYSKSSLKNNLKPEEPNLNSQESYRQNPKEKTKLMSVEPFKKPYSCSYCDKQFSQKTNLVPHERIHRGEKPFSCAFCSKAFTQKSNLVAHERLHNKEKLFTCSFCDKQFAQKSNMVAHKRSHSGEKPFTCSYCDKGFAQKSNLVAHERLHRGEKPFSCEICTKQFTQKSNLVTHERLHSELVLQKLFSCSFCDKQYAQRGNLAVHERSHTGEKPFSCKICDMTFAKKSYLVGHERTHTGNTPYSCDYCPKQFRQLMHKSRHERTHLGIKEFSCAFCKKEFSQKTHLMKHRCTSDSDFILIVSES